MITTKKDNIIPNSLTTTDSFGMIHVYCTSIDFAKSTQRIDGACYHFTDMMETIDDEPKAALPKICKCCGAPLKNWRCDYCGVEYD